MASSEGLGIAPIELSHGVRQICLGRFRERMKGILHQAIGVQEQMKPGDARSITLSKRCRSLSSRNRLRLAARPIQKRVQAHITWLEKELEGTNTDLTTTMRQSAVWREKEDVLRSVPGVGPVFTTTLLANLPELGRLTRKEVAALTGVAPFPRDSGTLKDRRAIWGGRAQARAALYMVALVATRKNPVIRTFYQRLGQAGKAKKLALTACMRKLLPILNPMVKSGTPWRVVTSEPA